MNALTPEQAKAAVRILQDVCGYVPYHGLEADQFASYFTRPTIGGEHARYFEGVRGFQGQLWHKDGKLYVVPFNAERTIPGQQDMLDRVNARLAGVLAQETVA